MERGANIRVKLQSIIQIGFLQEIINRHNIQESFEIVMTDHNMKMLVSTSNEIKAINRDVVAGQVIADNFVIEMPKQETVKLLPTQPWREAKYVYHVKLEKFQFRLRLVSLLILLKNSFSENISIICYTR